MSTFVASRRSLRIDNWHHVIPSNRGKAQRPTHKELSNKLRDCAELIASGQWLPCDPAKLKANFDELEKLFGVETTLAEDQTEILFGALKEITPDHYSGARPPPQSYERVIRGKELLAFRWRSGYFKNKEMYFKFCVSGSETSKRAYVCSIHPHRPGEND